MRSFHSVMITVSAMILFCCSALLAAEALSQSQYGPVRKFYAALRAAEALKPDATNTPPEVHRWRRQASDYLNEAVKDKAMPPTEVYEACDDLLRAVKMNKRELEAVYQGFEPIIFKNWPSNASLYLLKGTFYTDYSWRGRGGENADKVTDECWRIIA